VSDTGAPWNLPYPLPADLVRDGADAIKDLAEAVADELAAGIGTNIVQTVKNDAFSTSAASYTAVTGVSVSITPTSATSKVLLLVQLNYQVSPVNAFAYLRLLRDSTNVYLGTGGTNNVSAVWTARPTTQGEMDTPTLVVLDSPDTASAVTYSLEVNVASSTFYLNRRSADTNFVIPSSITAIEVAV